MNRKEYNSDTRYAKVLEQMDLLGIMDVSTTRQSKNGTITWKLPIKNYWPGNQKNATCIEVASFKSGYVRTQNSGYSNYQLNNIYFEDEYYPEREIDENYNYGKLTGKYTKFQTKKCKLIPIEIDRLEYLIGYCLKNYYIKHANFVANGEYIPKWTHKWELERIKDKHSDELDSRHVYDCGHYDRIKDLEDKLEKLDKFNDSLLDFNKSMNTHEVSVTVNGQKYKVI